MRIKNVGTSTLSIGDLQNGDGVIGVTLAPGAELVVDGGDAEKSLGLKALITAGIVTVLSSEETTDLEPDFIYDSVNKFATFEENMLIKPTEAIAKMLEVKNTTGSAVAAAITVSASGAGSSFTNDIVLSSGTKLSSTGDNVVLTNAGATKSYTITMGTGGGTGAMISDIAVDANLSTAAQAVVTAGACDVDANLSTAAQAVVTAGACDVDANLSTAAQAAVTGAHGVNDANSSSVQLTGNQSVSGVKTITGSLDFTGIPVNYQVPNLKMGIYGGPYLADTSLLDQVFASIAVRTGVNKTVPDTSCMALYVNNGNTADGINNKMQGVLSSMAIAYDVFDAYAGQFHIAITDDMATSAGNANLVGLACKAGITGGKTATGNVSALYCVLDGSGDTATGTYDAIRIENNATTCDSAINFGATSGMGYLFNMATGGCVAASTTQTISNDGYSIKVKINGEDCYIRCCKTA